MSRNLLLLLGMAAFPPLVSADWNDTSTGIDLNRLPTFPLTKIRSGWLWAGTHITFDGISAWSNPGKREVVLRGTSQKGKAWEAHLHALDEVWKGDLDGNGVDDFVLIASGPYFNGRITPVFSISILLMGDDRLPVPFFTAVYKGEGGIGIKHIVDLDHDGRAELLTSWYDEAASDPLVGVFCSGHWVTQLYRFREFRAEEVQGKIANLTFPFVHNWSYRGTGCAVGSNSNVEVQAPTLHEHGTAMQREVSATIVGRREESIEILPVRGCRSIQAPVVVYDRLTVRMIAIENLWDSAKYDLEEAIRRDGAPVRLSGLEDRQHDGYCSANLIWGDARAKVHRPTGTRRPASAPESRQ